jgi:YVTN family beta-propeller protein
MPKHLPLCSIALTVASALFSHSVYAQSRVPTPFLLVANQKDHSLSFVDPLTNRQVGQVDVGGITGHEVTVSPDGQTAYVPIYGDSGVGKPGTDGQIIAIVDVPSRKVTSTVDFGHAVRPHLPVYDTQRNLLYVTTELDQTISIIDPKTLKIVGSIPTTQAESHMFVLSPDGKRIYTANVGPGTVSVIDIATRKLITVIPIAAKTQRISISNDGKFVFTSDQTKPRLAVIDTATNQIKYWVPLADLGYGSAPTRDGRWLLVAHRATNQVSVVDLQTLKVVRTIEVPKDPTEILISPDDRTAYVSCGAAHQVAAIATADWKVHSLIDAGNGADGLAWAK